MPRFTSAAFSFLKHPCQRHLNHPPEGGMVRARSCAAGALSDQTAPGVYREMVKELRASLTRLVLETDRLLTVQQRRKAVTSIQRLVDELHGLSQGS